MRKYFILLLALLLIMGCSQSEIPIEDGYWEGIVTIKDSKFFIYLTAKDNQLFLAIPEQLISDVPVEDLRVSDEELSFSLQLGTATLRFVLFPQQNGFDGKVLYNTTSGTVMLREGRYTVEHRKLEAPERLGSQVSITTPRATLYGTYLAPTGSGPFPTLLFVQGSGPTDRDGNSELIVESNDNLWHLAHELRDAGIATVRYDKFAVGTSMPEQLDRVKDTDFDDFVSDAVQWLEYIKEQLPYTEIGILGHSEGSLVALLASQQTPVDYVISVAGNGDPIANQMIKQVSRINEEAGQILKKRLDEIKNSQYAETGNVYVDTFIPLGSEKYLQSWMAYNPSDVLRNTQVPVLVTWGSRDERFAGADDLFEQSGIPQQVIFAEIPNMGHMLRYAENDIDLKKSYSDRTMPLHPQFLETVISFILQYSTTGGAQ